MNYRYISLKAAFLVFGLCVALWSQDQKIGHIESKFYWELQPLTHLAVDQRLVEASETYQEYAPIPRVAFFDIAYPSSKQEYESLGGNAILLVTAVVQDSSELPLESVYLTGPDSMIHLSTILSSLTRIDDSTGVVVSTFGYYREDKFLVLPIDVWLQKTRLLIDFRGERKGFQLVSREDGIPEQLKELLPLSNVNAAPNLDAVLKLIAREYPGLAP